MAGAPPSPPPFPGKAPWTGTEHPRSGPGGAPDHEPRSWTVQRWLRHWLDTRTKIRPTTRFHYSRDVENVLVAYLGRYRLDDLNAQLLRTVFTQIAATTNTRGRPQSASAMQHLRTTLRAALNLAVREGILDCNPARHIEISGYQQPHAKVWTDARVQQWERTGNRPWRERPRMTRGASKSPLSMTMSARSTGRISANDGDCSRRTPSVYRPCRWCEARRHPVAENQGLPLLTTLRRGVARRPVRAAGRLSGSRRSVPGRSACQCPARGAPRWAVARPQAQVPGRRCHPGA